MMASRKELTLKEQVEVIKYAKKYPRVGNRLIAQHFKCGRTQIQSILREKDEITTAYKYHAQATRMCMHRPAFADMDDGVYRWYSFVRERNVPVPGPMLQQEALQLARVLGKEGFKTTNGWLDCLKKRHNIKNLIIIVQSQMLLHAIVQSWTLLRRPSGGS